jgi:MinD-like ATPase involved in chromosome partitioning or flagellar assembly
MEEILKNSPTIIEVNPNQDKEEANPKPKKGTTITIFGSRNGIGRKFVAWNIASELVRRYLKVGIGSSFSDNLEEILVDSSIRFANKDKDNQLYLLPTAIKELRYLGFSREGSNLSPSKLEEMLISFPAKLQEEFNYFIFSMKDPFEYPDRYVLLHTDIYIMITKVEASLFSDIFQTLEKLAFLPKKPKEIFFIFNQVKDVQMAYETYLKILQQAEDFNINIKISFLGNIPQDMMRQNIAASYKKPIVDLFSDGSFKGSIGFIVDKILGMK